MQVEAFHQQPGIVGHDAVLEESHDQLTAHLDGERPVSPRLGNDRRPSGGHPQRKGQGAIEVRPQTESLGFTAISCGHPLSEDRAHRVL